MATAAEYQAAYLRIFQNNTLSDAQAAALAAQDTGAGYNTAAYQAWANGLTTNVEAVYSTGGVVAIWSALTGRVPTTADLVGQVNTIESLTQQFGNSSIAFKALGASLANSSAFNGTFAATYNQDTNTLLGQQTFVSAAFTKAFGREPTITELNTNVAVFQTVKAFYAKTAVTETTTDARAKGEFISDLIKQAFDFSIGPNTDLPIFDQAQATIVALGNNTYIPNAPIESQPGSISGSAGTTFTLTANTDGPGAVAPAANTLGTDGDDTYNGVLGATLTTGDVIDGRSGNDTLKAVANGNTDQLIQLTSVETVDVSNFAAGTNAQMNLANSTGVKNLVASNGSGTATFNNVGSIADVAVNGTTAGGIAVNYTAATTVGTADVQKVTVNNATTSTGITVNGVETINLVATGTSTVDAVASNTLKTVNITGAGNLTVAGALTGATTVDASAATGNLNVSLDTTKDVSYKGGTGSDVVNVAGGLTNADSIDGGTGAGVDFIRFDAAASLPAAKITNVTNFEGIQIDAIGAAAAVNVDNFSGSSLTQFRVGTNALDADPFGAFTLAITNGVTNSTIEVQSDSANTGVVTFALKTDGTADVLNVNLRNNDTDGTQNEVHGIATLTANTIETINVNSSNLVVPGATLDNDILSIGNIVAAAATKINITGDSAVRLGATGVDTLTALTSVDASTMTKAVQLGVVGNAFGTSNTGADIKTGSANDIVSLDVGNTGSLKTLDMGGQAATTGSIGDTLALSGGGALTGVTIIDLTSTTDQVSQLLGSVNSAAQIGIESVDLSGLNGTAQITGTSGVNVIVGTVLGDTINAGGGNDTVTGGAGADNITLGAGADTAVMAANASVARTAETITEAAVVANQTITFGNGVDVINDFVSGTDKLDVTTAANYTQFAVGSDVQGLTANNNYGIRGNYDGTTGTFTVTNAGADMLVSTNSANADFTANTQTGMVVLLGVTALTTADFV